ncbi:MAG: GH25 family lysozyme [Lachnospiraceae bacterium]|nr:GH25 family lysozyme [Lachnospiraceae bacterium]
MELNGIDISDYQADIDLSKVAADFVIPKATEGIGYVSPSCDRQYQQAKKLGKLLGVYHFARPEYNSAYSEVEFFIKNIKGYLGQCAIFLDWESAGMWNVSWALQWLQYFRQKTGIAPVFYTYESVLQRYDWSPVAKAGFKLWAAKYRDYGIDNNYDMTNAGSRPRLGAFSYMIMWQWTSVGRLNGYGGNLDCDRFYGSPDDWRALYGKIAPAQKTQTQTKTTAVYRLYNPTSQDHFYTIDSGEKSQLVGTGWRYEGIAWMSPSSGTPVIRFFNAKTGDHMYTASATEGNNLVKTGWKREGTAFFSKSSGTPVFRLYKSKTCDHLFTASTQEKQSAILIGYKDEGTAFYV